MIMIFVEPFFWIKSIKIINNSSENLGSRPNNYNNNHLLQKTWDPDPTTTQQLGCPTAIVSPAEATGKGHVSLVVLGDLAARLRRCEVKITHFHW